VNSADQRPHTPDRPEAARLRPACADDIETLFEIRCSVRENHLDREQLAARGISADALRDMIRSPDWLCLIAEREGEALGFCMAQRARGEVFALFLRPQAEGQGIGRQLMQAAEADLFAAGHDTLSLATGDDPTLRAYGFYRELGWQPGEPAPHGDRVFRKRRGI
jgi:GNAT superfamily N-acetyltransferase